MGTTNIFLNVQEVNYQPFKEGV